MIKFNNEKTNKQVLETVRNHTKSFDLEQLVNASRADLFHMDDAVRTLYFATITGQNAILYGPGGYGKSRVVKHFYNSLGIPVYTKVCNSSTTVEDLLGIPDMNKLMNESTYETAFDKTIFKNKGILFLEEGLDMQPEVAAALKDVLTTKGYHQGNQIDPSFITSVIIATNKNPQECALDDSTAAFYEERFPYVLKIEWKSHEYADYYEFLSTSRIGMTMEDKLVKLLASVYEENKLSPRKCLYYSQLIDQMGVEYLTKIPNLNTKSIDEMLRLSEEKDQLSRLIGTFNNMEFAISKGQIEKLPNLIQYCSSLKCPEDQMSIRDSYITKARLALKNYDI